jgi:hypothetical protein
MIHGTALETPWKEDVAEFATAKGIADSLPFLADVTMRLFPEYTRLEVFVEDDPELPDFHFVVFQVSIPLLSVEDRDARRHEWNRTMLQHCPLRADVVFLLQTDTQD